MLKTRAGVRNGTHATNGSSGGGHVLRGSDDVIVSLFCGAGGLDRGFGQAGYQSVLAIDVSKAACETFKRNHPKTTKVLQADLRNLSPNAVIQHIEALHATPVGVIGGSPCQAFSQGNSFKKAWDRRASLTRRYAEIIQALNRRYKLDFFVFENF